MDTSEQSLRNFLKVENFGFLEVHMGFRNFNLENFVRRPSHTYKLLSLMVANRDEIYFEA